VSEMAMELVAGGTDVRVENLLVTGVRTDGTGFYVTQYDLASDYGSIFVQWSGSVSVSDTVEVVGHFVIEPDIGDNLNRPVLEAADVEDQGTGIWSKVDVKAYHLTSNPLPYRAGMVNVIQSGTIKSVSPSSGGIALVADSGVLMLRNDIHADQGAYDSWQVHDEVFVEGVFDAPEGEWLLLAHRIWR
jgi:hypothetical protein